MLARGATLSLARDVLIGVMPLRSLVESDLRFRVETVVAKLQLMLERHQALGMPGTRRYQFHLRRQALIMRSVAPTLADTVIPSFPILVIGGVSTYISLMIYYTINSQ